MEVVCQWHPLAWLIAALHFIVALSMHATYSDCGRVKNAGNVEVRWVCNPALIGLPAIAHSPT